jgi:hypothetical protein
VDAWFASALRASHSPIRLSRSGPGRRLLDAPPWSGVRLRPRGSRSDPDSSVPGHQRLFSPIRPTRGHIAISPTMRLIRDAFAVRERLSDPRVVPSFRCTFFPGMPPSMSPGRSEIVFPSLTIPTWPSPRSERLGSSGYPAIRFKQGSFSGLIGSPLLRPARLLAPLDGSGCYPATRAFPSRLSMSPSPFSLLDITTTDSGISVGGTLTH